MANERYVSHQVQPSLGDRAVGTGKAVIEKGGEFIRHADDAVDMAPPAAAVWLAVIVGVATYKFASSVGKNIGPRDGVARLVRGAACVCAAWMVGSCAHDTFLESKGYAVNGKQPKYEQIQTSPRTADFEKASKPIRQSSEYAPRVRQAPPSVAPTERRHNKPIARPE